MSCTIRVGFCVLASALVFSTPSLQAAWVEDGVPLCTDPLYQGNPAIAADNSGGAIVVWWDYRNGADPDVYAQRVNAAGDVLWDAAGLPICVQPGDQYAAQIVSDGAGGAIVTWHDERSGSYQWDIYAQHIDSSGNPLWAVDGVLICGAGQYQTDPQIVTDGHHGAIIAWSDERGYVAKDIYAQRVDGAGNVLWAADGVPICTAPVTQDNFKMIPDGSGGAYITWQDARTGGADYWDIYAQRVSQAGVVYWVANGIRICNAVDDQQWPDIVADGVGGAIIAWSDSRNAGDYDIYAQRVDPDGIVYWAANGVCLCNNAGNQYDPRVASDGQQGAIMAWRDYAGALNDLYAQRVAADGTVLWPATGGVAICTASGDQMSPRVVADGAGGAVMAWEDRRDGIEEADVHAQRVDAHGNILWALNGKVISAAPYGQRFVCAASDGADGAIVAWQDYRSNVNWDIYAQSTAYVPSDVVGGESSLLSGQASGTYPNPFCGSTPIRFAAEGTGAVLLRVYDASGRLIRVISNASGDAAFGELVWDGKDEHGRGVPDGAYFCRLSGAGPETIRRVIRAR